ncbi:ARF/SAR superfamily [Tricholoma matsutake]|nr:ARF/SAR superfamily [Tricholoma matsutake 945]
MTIFKQMSNALRQFISRFQSKSASYNVTIAGLDGSGKTTFLSLLKLGEVVQVIPSLGLNVESVEFPMASGRVFKFTGWDVGAGSCNISTSKMIELHTVNGDAMIWVVDSCDRTRLPECVEDFTSAIGRVNSHRLRVGTAQRDYPILILANKQDHPEAMSVVDLRKAFAKALSGRTVSIFETSLTRGVVKGGILDALDWLLLALEEASTRHSNTVPCY